MKLPRADRAVVDQEKIQQYLLNASHPDNGGKADFFKCLGFRQAEWRILAGALQDLAREELVAKKTESPHGEKYIIVGKLRSPSGRTASVKTIWIVDNGQERARLVTAYPERR
jgi:hypothetical protein